MASQVHRRPLQDGLTLCSFEIKPGLWHAWVQQPDGRSVSEAADGPSQDHAERYCIALTGSRFTYHVNGHKAAWAFMAACDAAGLFAGFPSLGPDPVSGLHTVKVAGDASAVARDHGAYC